jgi:hypothetical protein
LTEDAKIALFNCTGPSCKRAPPGAKPAYVRNSMRIARLAGPFLLAAGIVSHAGCDRPGFSIAPGPKKETAGPKSTPAGPSADDTRVAREAITLADVLVMLQANVPNEKITADVTRRHIPQTLVDAGELELAANGAGHILIAALKDPKNLLTENQDKAYRLILTERLKASNSVVRRR